MSETWQWISFGLAVLATLMAAPTLFQMIGGKPSLKVEFVTSRSSVGEVFRCYVSNRRIQSRLMRWVGVQRSPADIAVSYSVSEAGTNKVIAHLVRPEISLEGGVSALRIQLPAGLPAIVPIGVAHNGGVELLDHPGVVLSGGKYKVKLSVANASKSVEAESFLVVGQESYWIDS